MNVNEGAYKLHINKFVYSDVINIVLQFALLSGLLNIHLRVFLFFELLVVEPFE